MKKIVDSTLYFDGCNTVDLAKKYGTPVYIMSETEIVNRIGQLKEQFTNKYENTRIAYASKAFSTMAMYGICNREGICIDVVSGGELYTAMQIDFPAERIEFNGNNKSTEELEMAIEYGVGRIIVDSPQELDIINKVCKEKNLRTKIIYRITPGVAADSHDYVVTGKKDSKFGFPLDEDVIKKIVKEGMDSSYVDLLGFHFHVGSQLHVNDAFVESLDVILGLIKDVKNKYNFDLEELNIGGGFGAVYTNEDRKEFSYFLDPMMKRIQGFYNEMGTKRPTIVIEPGRSIVAEAGMTLYTVGAIKDIKNVRKYVSVDGGMTDNIRTALYQAEYDGTVVNKADKDKEEIVTICGKCCECGDILIRDIEVPKVEAGDIFGIYTTGAYCYTMASNYNKIPVPPVVLVKDGKDQLIVKRQSYQDLIKNEIMPSL